ncbi:MAG: M15 family peptidase [Desulfovibrio sp.]|nr:MAG: M15 family peptidase [Desulfovibrio sp.]
MYGELCLKSTVLALAATLVCSVWTGTALAREGEASESVIVDSAMESENAIWEHLPPDCPGEFPLDQVLVDVRYYSFDGELHQGQVVIHKDLAEDIRQVFEVIEATRFPVASVKPVAHPDIQALAPYGFCPDTDNSSGFACRSMVGASRPSRHAQGLAFDLNPRQNPYISGDTVLPPGSVYDPQVAGALTPGHPVVLAFKELGWTWGGDWGESRGFVDYMHFQKVP